jgi:hypothetical protein
LFEVRKADQNHAVKKKKKKKSEKNTLNLLEEHLFKQSQGGDSARRPSRALRMKLNLARNELGGKFTIGGGTRTTAPQVGSNAVNLVAHFLGDNGAGSCPRVGGQHHAILRASCVFVVCGRKEDTGKGQQGLEAQPCTQRTVVLSKENHK